MLDGVDERTQRIYEPIQEDLLEVERRLRSLSSVGTSYLPALLDYVLHTGGKRVRPAITSLSAKFHPGDPELPIVMAMAVELLHIATLIHDDTVDKAALRRGKATVSDVWGRDVAVLLGDYVFATSATFVCDTGNVRVIRRFSETIMELSSGELHECFNTNNWRQSREDYNERIFLKTASLFQTSAETGAILSGASEETVQASRLYGYNIGMAFQIVDDILDVEGDPNEVGKPVGQDLLQGILTLPAIILMERCPGENPIEKLFLQDDQERAGGLERVLEMVHNSKVIEDCYQVVQEYCLKATNAISSLPDNPARRSLLDLARYVMERRR